MSHKKFILYFSLILLCSSAWADDRNEIWAYKGSPERPSYYSDRQWGWYWNENLEPPQEETKDSDIQAVHPQTQKSSERYPSLNDYTYEEIWNMHPDDFQDLSNRITKKAIQYQTEENVLETIVLKDIAQRKAAAFASVNMLVTQKHPEFSSFDRYPTTSPGKLALRDEVQDSLSNHISAARDDFALIMFTQDGCRFCDAQRAILDRFLNSMYGWTAREANVTRETTSANMAEKFGVESFPSIIIVYRQTGQYIPVSTGVISFDDLRNKIYFSIRYLKGETAPEQYFLYDFQEGSGSDPLKNLKRNSALKHEEGNYGSKQP